MKKKLNIGLIFGGRSGEHEVSLISARSIWNALDKNKYNIILIGISKKGYWHLGDSADFWIDHHDPKAIRLNLEAIQIIAENKDGRIFLTKNGENLSHIDVFFPITHGVFGEDGCLQGFLELLSAAYVGPNVLGSAVCMDKDVMKRLLIQAGISTARFYSLSRSQYNTKFLDKITRDLKFPIFVKPANTGSSVGISKAKNKKELREAIEEAFQYDNKIVLEEHIQGREIECSVMGNEKPVASVPGEIKLKSEFYSYEAKYLDESLAMPIPVANLPKKTVKKIQELAIKVFKTLECEGMGRVDFFITPNGKIYVNEINTLPGFTSISMYPKMFEKSGLKFPALLDKLIQLALNRQRRNDKLKRSFA